MGKQRKDNQRRNKILRNMTLRRLGVRNVSNAEIVRLIWSRHPLEIKLVEMGRYAVMAWFCEQFVGPLPAGQSRVVRRAFEARLQATSDEFLASFQWRRLRMEVLKERGRRCECCGATPSDGVTVVHVDHIKPRKLHPELALEKSNLQILCATCNHGKGNWDQTDWRERLAPFWAKQ
jgi:5-methylcytosine-specific restriction endonuclease McrA